MACRCREFVSRADSETSETPQQRERRKENAGWFWSRIAAIQEQRDSDLPAAGFAERSIPTGDE